MSHSKLYIVLTTKGIEFKIQFTQVSAGSISASGTLIISNLESLVQCARLFSFLGYNNLKFAPSDKITPITEVHDVDNPE